MKISQELPVDVIEIIDGILGDKRFEFLKERGFLRKDNSSSTLSPQYRLQESLRDPEVVKETTDYFNRLKSNVKDWFELEEDQADLLGKEGLIGANDEITEKGRDVVIQRIDEFITKLNQL